MKKLIFATALALTCGLGGAAECSRGAALSTQARMAELAQAQPAGPRLAVHWVFPFEKEAPDKQLKLVKNYTDMDFCLSGGAREIMFYRKGKLVATASPAAGVRLEH